MSRGYAEEVENSGFWSRLKEKMGMGEYEDDDYEEMETSESGKRRNVLLRLHSPRPNEISVKLQVSSLADAKDAADRLKAHQSVILNLENTDEVTAGRVVDFVSGVTYAVDGYYQKVGEKVFLFTPESTQIDVQETAQIKTDK